MDRTSIESRNVMEEAKKQKKGIVKIMYFMNAMAIIMFLVGVLYLIFR